MRAPIAIGQQRSPVYTDAKRPRLVRCTRGRILKAFFLAGISALALCACTTTPGGVTGSYAPVSVATAPSEFRIVPDAEVLASRPEFKPGGDAKAYVASYLDWIFTPGHLVERSVLSDMEPEGLPEGGDFYAMIAELAEEGNPAALLMNAGDDPAAPQKLADSGNYVARLVIELDKISVGSIQQKVDALGWFRAEAPRNGDAGFAFGTFLLTQGGGGDFMGMPSGGAPTPGEVREGAALLFKSAQAAPLDVSLQAASVLGPHAGVDAEIDTRLRKLLEVVVGATSLTPIPQPDIEGMTDDQAMEAYGAYELKMSDMMGASVTRVSLASMLQKGQGGAVDLDRAKLLYREALDATQDMQAYTALGELGVDVSAYDHLFAAPPEGNDGWGEEPEIAPEPPAAPPHQH